MARQASSTVTPASAFFINELVKMEPGTQDAGVYANKPGYHGTRAENDARTGKGTPDYSCRAPADRRGPADKAAAYDWTHEKAHSGNYASMAKYGVRLKAAFDARDPRLFGWREALGQTDTDATPEGLDFQGWYTRTPDGTHAWHWHFSEVREYVANMINKLCMLSVLAGESLAAYLARGGALLGGAVTTVDLNLHQLLGATFPTDYTGRKVGHTLMDLQNLRNFFTDPPGKLRADTKKPWVEDTSVAAIMLRAAQKTLETPPPAPVVLTPEDRAAIIAGVLEGLGALRFVPEA